VWLRYSNTAKQLRASCDSEVLTRDLNYVACPSFTAVQLYCSFQWKLTVEKVVPDRWVTQAQNVTRYM